MKSFRCSGKIGDLIYSLPTIEALGGGVLYVPQDAPEVPGFYSNMRSFLEQIPYITNVIPYIHVGGYMESMRTPHVDYDLDLVRLQPHRGRKFMVQQYFDAFGIKKPTPDKWLDIPHTRHNKTLVNVTPRHRQGCNYNWTLAPISSYACFVGDEQDYLDFPLTVDYMPTWDFLELAQAVAGAHSVWCSQSSVLTLCQAMQIPYYCTFKPGKTNCRTYLPNEHAL